MTIPDTIQPLVDKYSFHRDAYLRGQEKYNETQLRNDFIDPFFHSLGWDVNNDRGHSEAYREVLHEEPVRIRGTTYFFDYTFRIGGVRKFIVETKKPSVSIKDDADSALQLRRYAWNAKLPLSILTNFEEWAIYDCTIKPENGDSAAKGRIEYFTYDKLSSKWEYLVSIFSQDSILKGSFDKYADSQKGKKGTATVDNDILTEIESWREALAKNIALRNPALSVEELNAVVQRTIDRIIFLRICEDRGIEEYPTLYKLLEGEHVYARLSEIFRQADAKYNSGIFHFEKEPDWDEMPDTLSLGLIIDDKVLKGIIKRLYYPETPYLFSVIPPAILGHVYEQFLGKVIRLTEGHQARVEYKPEVKKAGGVFYTPQYIVEYIVKHTVGELVKGTTPREWSKLRILDPACGSGSFLIGAYQFLLDRHRDWYIENLVPVFIEKKSVTDPAVLALLPEATPRGKKKLAAVELPIYKAGSSGDATKTRSDWRLTTAEKKRILLNNIFGVDIDQQAVEVTKLSLLLKVLEEENEENIDKQLKLFAERALPSLHENIKCGNSLIGTDILAPEMQLEDVKRINPFDWDREFADVMKAGGFDAVIGNPPYVRQELIKDQKEYLQDHYSTFHGNADLYVYFVEKGTSLLRNNGLFSFIVANKWMRANYGKDLRRFIAKKTSLIQIIDFGELPVFQNASTFPSIIITKRTQPQSYNFSFVQIKNLDFQLLDDEVKQIGTTLSNQAIESDNWALTSDSNVSLLRKVELGGIPLKDYLNCKIYNGIKTGLNKAFVLDPETKDRLIDENPDNASIIKPFLMGRDIDRYQSPKITKFLLFIPWHFPLFIENIKGSSQNAENQFKKEYPIIFNHLLKFKTELQNRASEETGIRYEWYALQRYRPEYYREFEKTKIVYIDIASKPKFILDNSGAYLDMTLFFIPTSDLFLLGFLNSSISWFYLKHKCAILGDAEKKGRLRLKTIYMNDLPIPKIDKQSQNRIVTLVTQMLDLNKKLQDAKLDHDRTLLQRQIEATDVAINKLVYELYGLTEEEIGIVEGKIE